LEGQTLHNGPSSPPPPPDKGSSLSFSQKYCGQFSTHSEPHSELYKYLPGTHLEHSVAEGPVHSSQSGRQGKQVELQLSRKNLSLHLVHSVPLVPHHKQALSQGLH
jgi:hypothetical protein